jgi:hypothetical protein
MILVIQVNSLERNHFEVSWLASGFGSAMEGAGAGLATWKTPLHPSIAEQRELKSSKSAKSLRFSVALSSFSSERTFHPLYTMVNKFTS